MPSSRRSSSKHKPRKAPKRKPSRHMRLPHLFWAIPILIGIGFMCVVGVLLRNEMRTSTLQSEWLSWYGARISFDMRPGANAEMRTPAAGPYNQRLGYTYLPFFIKALRGDDYKIAAQMRATPTYDYFLDRGFYPPYHVKTVAGLRLYDRDGQMLYAASYPSRVFADFQSIPPLMIATLLHIENRELLDDGPVTRNPVIEWDRFLYAAFGHVIGHFVPGLNAGGGSTLATQIEKFRFSPGGQTPDSVEKIRQIASASLRVYLGGPDTRKAREKIVLDYLNSTPLGARPGFGEVNSIGDGLWAWFGIDLQEAASALNLPEDSIANLRSKAHIYRAMLGLMLAQRRPTYYLVSNRSALDGLTNATLDRLLAAGTISQALHDTARVSPFRFLPEIPPLPQPPFVEQKAVNALRTHLMTMLGLKKLYELDRLDLAARSTLDQGAQKQTIGFLKKMGDPEFVQSLGLYGFRLLNPDNDPKKIKWSVVLYERTPDSNKIRIQADNVDEPFDMNEGMKLDLGSTAKLRTLVTYLEIISELHRRYAGLPPEDLKALSEDAPDILTSWATGWLTEHPAASLDELLQAAMNRSYSGSPGEAFFTGGGMHTFNNFEKEEDYQSFDLHDAFRHSVNLVFVRLMRDIVNYTIGQGTQTKQELLDDPDQPARQQYLERFAEQEGSVFLNRYINDYNGLTPAAILAKISARGHKGATARTILFRSLWPEATYEEFAAFMAQQVFRETLGEARLRQLYKDYPVARYNLADRAYITGINPMELWLVSYLQANPRADRRSIMDASRPVRIESYRWLFRPHLKRAQDTRIRIILEADAFARIQKRWARLGYPFERLVPSFATAIGSSADRPGALAELVGIILNDGVRRRTTRFDSLEFGQGTPYQTLLMHNEAAAGQQVLDPAITRIVKSAMVDVVENGTAKRVKGTYKDAAGQPLAVGGKTGTGDHRFDEYAAGGRLISSRVVNRTGTFAFFIGDRFFGTVTAHVAGEEAGNYKFTSALSSQMLKALAPVLQPVVNGAL
ncbi:MAG: transglycosylase domain-containing protein [Alphaproteobacteria bacterium]|nr:transglycosylase domain-containing protein [Alphaproteobacteria bacterium]